MKIHYLKSASVIIEANSVKILCDPWLIDGEYYGSWYHYPPYDFEKENFDNIDFIYISHIHPDHFSILTLEQLNKKIPVLIHEFGAPFLKNNIEKLGFTVQEIPHNLRTHLKNGVHINILAADDCNPELCLKYFGCGIYKSLTGSAQIDTLSVIDNDLFTVLNVNDNPLALTEKSLNKVLSYYSKIDFLLVGYAGAGPFPQCFPDLSEDQRMILATKKKMQFLNQGLDYIKAVKPEYFMPFAGTYLLGGKLIDFNPFRGVPNLDEALTYLKDGANESQGVLLNSNSWFDLETGKKSETYIPIDPEKKQIYIEEILSDKKFTFEDMELPKLGTLTDLIESSNFRMNRMRDSMGFASSTIVVVPLVEGKSAYVTMDGNGYKIEEDKNLIEPYVKLKLDPRLLFFILKGPQYAHWQNAEIGSHIEYSRKPEKFERGLYYCMNFFHS